MLRKRCNMARQIGKRKSRTYYRSPSRRWPWLLVGFMAGILFTSYLHHKQMLPDFFPKNSTPISKKVEQTPIKKVPQFDFYTILKGEQNERIPKPKPTFNPKTIPVVQPTITDIQKPTTEKDASVHEKIPYFLQAAALQNPKDADQLKAQLILAGYSVHIKKIFKNKTTWFRVLIGPYPDKIQAEIAKKQLNEQHIKAHLVSAI
jgi:cell division protein FtsN